MIKTADESACALVRLCGFSPHEEMITLRPDMILPMTDLSSSFFGFGGDFLPNLRLGAGKQASDIAAVSPDDVNTCG